MGAYLITAIGAIRSTHALGRHFTDAPALAIPKLLAHRCAPVFFFVFKPVYRLIHLENYLFLISKIIIIGSKYPKKMFF